MNSQNKYPKNLLSNHSSETELASPFLGEVFTEAQLPELENLKTPSEMFLQESPFLNVEPEYVGDLPDDEAFLGDDMSSEEACADEGEFSDFEDGGAGDFDDEDEWQQEWEHEEDPGGPFGAAGGDAPGPFSRNELADELLAEDESIFSRVRGAIERGASNLAFLARIQAGERDEGKLTNQVFFARHPERNGRKLQRSEKKLAAEWRQIRDTIVRPAIRAAEQASRITVTPDPVGASNLAFLARIQAGERDEGKLTNQVFFARHPERNGRKLQRSEKKLAAEWRQIRDTIVRPAIRAAEQASRITVTPDPVGFEGSMAASGWILAWTNQFVDQQEQVRAANEAIDAINSFHDRGKLRDWSEALDTLALEFLKEPGNSGGLPAVSSRFLEWIRSEGNLATQTRLAQLVWRKVDPQKSRKYQDYAMFVATALGSPASLLIIHREDSNQLARMIRGMMHWLWLRNNVVNHIALAGARAYSLEIGVGVLRFMAEPTSSNEDAYEDPAARLGELLAMLRLAAGELRGGVSMDALLGFVLKGLAMVATVNMGAPGKAVVSLSTDLVKALVGTSKPRVSSEEQFERRLRRLFTEIYWNTVDLDRKFHWAEGDRLVFQAGSERVRELRDREREIVNVIFTAFQRGKTWRLGN